jgi:hypothetical protein
MPLTYLESGAELYIGKKLISSKLVTDEDSQRGN